MPETAIYGTDLFGEAIQPKSRGKIADDFYCPPFTVLSTREGWWQERKAAWIAKGIKSEVGRPSAGDQGETASLKGGTTWGCSFGPYDQRKRSNTEAGTSVFDPVLCELAYRWFCPPGGMVLDPFAGGSVRGIVAGLLGRRYHGIELRPEQVAANEAQADDIIGPATDFGPDDLTPVTEHGGIWIKRDDLFAFGGVRGGKVRTCRVLADGDKGLITAGSRSSPQVNIVAHVARAMGVPCRVHVPAGELSPEVAAARDAGADVVQHTPGYNTVIVARARDDAANSGWTLIPFGMECEDAVAQTRRQVRNVPADARRIVVPVGSAMSLAGVLWGLADAGLTTPVVGVCVGADPAARLDRYAPPGWRDRVTLVQSGIDYHRPAPETILRGVALDPIYEAKCIPHVRDGDLLWVVGIRQTAAPESVESAYPRPTWETGDSRDRLPAAPPADLIFSCPPYFDLERYSDDPADLSAMGWDAFLSAYRAIIAASVARLRPDRFACFVVGDVRDGDGNYRNLPGETIRAFKDAGAALYNEAVLMTPVGSLPIRIGSQFRGSRKLGRTHQTIYVFLKGNAKRAASNCGEIAG